MKSYDPWWNVKPTTTPTPIADGGIRMMRFRSSSRCSRNDIFPAVASSSSSSSGGRWSAPTEGREGHQRPLTGATFYRRDGRRSGPAAGRRHASAAVAAAAGGRRLGRIRCSSMRISSSSVLFSSFEAFLNSARLLPSDLPKLRQLAGAEDDQSDRRKSRSARASRIEPNMSVSCFRNRGSIANYRNRRCERVKEIPRDLCPKSLPIRKLSASMPDMRRYRPLPVVVSRHRRLRPASAGLLRHERCSRPTTRCPITTRHSRPR